MKVQKSRKHPQTPTKKTHVPPPHLACAELPYITGLWPFLATDRLGYLPRSEGISFRWVEKPTCIKFPLLQVKYPEALGADEWHKASIKDMKGMSQEFFCKWRRKVRLYTARDSRTGSGVVGQPLNLIPPDRVGGSLSAPVLSHHRTYGNRIRRFMITVT